ncbi:MAG: butyrate kinase [bacterium]
MTQVQHWVLAINPGATSTKLALYQGDSLVSDQLIRHADEELAGFETVAGQVGLRGAAVRAFLAEAKPERLDAVVGRGGLLRPVASGTYRVDEIMLAELASADRGEHASNLGAILAQGLARELGVDAFIVDPVCVDELAPLARISGLAGLERESLGHALNTKAVARRYAEEVGRPYPELRLVVAHLGTGISVSAHRDGRMVDVTNPRDEGPMSPDRPGSLPTGPLVDRCFRTGADRHTIRRELLGGGGMRSYLDTTDLREARARIAAGDGLARQVVDAMVYQIGKAVGEMATVLRGELDAVLLTGGLAHDTELVEAVVARVGWIAPTRIYAGEDELRALAQGALRVLRGQEKPRLYGAVGEGSEVLI